MGLNPKNGRNPKLITYKWTPEEKWRSNPRERFKPKKSKGQRKSPKASPSSKIDSSPYMGPTQKNGPSPKARTCKALSITRYLSLKVSLISKPGLMISSQALRTRLG